MIDSNSWESGNLDSVTSLIKDGTHGTHAETPNGIPLLSAKDVRDGRLLIPENCRRISESDYRSIHKSYQISTNDMLLTIVGSIGRCYLMRGTEPKFSIQRSVGVIRPEGIEPEYLYHFLRSEPFQRSLNDSTNASAQGGVYLGSLAKCAVTYPIVECEQSKIAEILSTVDLAIEQTEALIAKQQRIKTGLMQDLLTRGIDEQGNLRSEETHQFKDSPLGRIPVEWDAKELFEVADLRVGYAFKSSWFAEDGVRLLRGENVGTGKADWKDTQWLPHHIAEKYPEYLLAEGDLVIGMDRTFTKQGFKVTLLGENDVPCLLVQRVGCFVPLDIPTQYMRLLIQSPQYQRELLLQQKGMDIPHLSKGEILSPLVPVPIETSEMDEIGKRVGALRDSIETNIRHVDKLRSMKTALMQDLLTGEKRVTPLLEPAVTT